MKIKTSLYLLTVLSALSFGAMAAQSVTLDQAHSMQPMGTISVSGIAGAPSDIHHALDQAAAAKGATAYRVTEAYDHDNWHATAQLYK